VEALYLARGGLNFVYLACFFLKNIVLGISTEGQSYFSEDSTKFKTIGKKKMKTLKKRTTDKMSSGRKIPQDRDQNKKMERFFQKKCS
jgi:hypothetical protein